MNIFFNSIIYNQVPGIKVKHTNAKERFEEDSILSDNDLLKININRIPTEGLDLKGAMDSTDFPVRETDSFSFSDPLIYDLHVSLIQQKLLVNGSASIKIKCICDRCLGKFNLGVKVSDICHYIEDFSGDEVDISELIREDLLLEIPMKTVCNETCLGLCPSCGQNLNESKCSCEPISPGPSVWDALDGLDL